MLDALGIDHIVVNLSSKRVNVRAAGRFRDMDRFDEGVKLTQVTPRLALFLAFTDVLGKPVRYGETFEGGGYIAKDMGDNVQLNAWSDKVTGHAYFGINIEHIATFRKILPAMNRREFETGLRKLGGYKLRLTKDRVPGRTGVQDINIVAPMPCPQINETCLRRLRTGIEGIINDHSRPRRWRPHLAIFKPLWRSDKLLSQEMYLETIRAAREELSELLRVLTVF